jgi:hypothetical protein
MSELDRLLPGVAAALREELRTVMREVLAEAAGTTLQQQWMDENELSARIAVPVKTLQSWRLRERGPPFRKFGRSVKYPLAGVEKWIERNQSEASR